MVVSSLASWRIHLQPRRWWERFERRLEEALRLAGRAATVDIEILRRVLPLLRSRAALDHGRRLDVDDVLTHSPLLPSLAGNERNY